MKEFTTDWFLQNIPTWEKILAPLAGKPIKALEIGCFEGRATVWLLENILTHPNAFIVCVDSFSSEEELKDQDWTKVKERFLSNTKEFENKISLKVGKSKEILQYMTPNIFDLIYVDGSHLASDVFIDLALSHLLLKPGGIIICDDWLWGRLEKNLHVPKPAIDAFMECFADKYEIVSIGYQLALKKK